MHPQARQRLRSTPPPKIERYRFTPAPEVNQVQYAWGKLGQLTEIRRGETLRARDEAELHQLAQFAEQGSLVVERVPQTATR